MIIKEELIQTEKSFKDKVETSTNKDYVIKKYNNYFNWLQDKFIEVEEDELKNIICSQQLKVIYSFNHWLDIHNIKAIEVSKDWNKKLVAKVGNYSNELEERKSNATLDDTTFKIKEHYVYQELFASRDIATVGYCWSILQRAIPNLIPLLIQTLEEKDSNTSETDKRVLRPGHDKQIPDDGRKYWHTGAKELMTYDECTEKGLGHHLLYDEAKRCYAGFKETDPAKIQKEFDEDTTKFLETVFVEPSIID